MKVEWQLVCADGALRPHERDTLEELVRRMGLGTVESAAADAFGWDDGVLDAGAGVARVGDVYVGVVMRVGEPAPSMNSLARRKPVGDVDRIATFIWVVGPVPETQEARADD